MTQHSYSLTALTVEREEMRKDLKAFNKAYEVLRQRLLESNETEIPRRPLLHEWSGSRAVVGSLEISIHAIERTIAELGVLIQQIEQGTIPNLDKPGRPILGVVDGKKPS